MKKGVVVGKLFLGLFLLIFLFGLVSAIPEGTCSVVAKASCDELSEGKAVVGLSAMTNAHAQNITGVAISNWYPYVLCCNIYRGGQLMSNNTCTPGNTNKVLSISALTNAHAQGPTQSGYTNSICYGDFECEESTSGSCGAIYPYAIVSISGVTNAHLANKTGTGSYNTKICCKGPSLFASTCTITSASWVKTEAVDGEFVEAVIGGSGPECDGQKVLFEVLGNYPAQSLENPNGYGNFYYDESEGATIARGTWQAERQTDLTGTPARYYFQAALENKPNEKISSGEGQDVRLLVNEYSEELQGYTSCEDYQDESSCNSNSANVDLVSNLPTFDCSDDNTVCGCTWTEENGCGLEYATITDFGTTEDGFGCNYGTTVCENEEGTYCALGDICPAGEEPIPSGDGVCEWGEGCSSADCVDGDADTCAGSLYCIAGECSSSQNPLVFQLPGISGSCKIIQTIEKDCQEEPVGYRIVSWIGKWTGSSGEAQAQCETVGKATVPCPAQVQLPFFDYFELFLSVLVIAVIYVSIVLKQKFRHGIKHMKKKRI